MVDQTKIEWTDFTVNFWEGCQKVGPGCDHCYAEARDTRFTGGKHWGPGAPRRKVKGGIPKLQKINRDAGHFYKTHGHWPRVFCSSLSDLFDNAVDPIWREEALTEIDCAGFTQIQMLTKRIGNVEKMVPDMWRDDGWPDHVGLMITVVNQEEANRDIPKLLDLKARLGIPWVGLSVEPMLGDVDVSRWLLINWQCSGCRGYFAGRYQEECPDCGRNSYWSGSHKFNPKSGMGQSGLGIDWVICGGESGPGARPMHPDWARYLRDQCNAAGVPFLFKQWGEWRPGPGFACPDDLPSKDWHHFDPECSARRVGKKVAGRLLDGREWNEVPA